jgi:hypothetical protein
MIDDNRPSFILDSNQVRKDTKFKKLGSKGKMNDKEDVFNYTVPMNNNKKILQKNYPDFFDHVPEITLIDPLSGFLGSIEGGEVTFTYHDIVKAAGHSCPTVSGAYLMAWHALRALYGSEKPVRGNVRVAFNENEEEGVAGVIGNVISLITGATVFNGFKGLNGRFIRHSLMSFGEEIQAPAQFTRIDTGKTVACYYNPGHVPPNPNMQPAMMKAMQGDEHAIKLFGRLWQERVQHILINHFNDEKVIRIVIL